MIRPSFLAQPLHLPQKIKSMRRILILSWFLFIYGSTVSAQIIKREKVKLNIKPTAHMVMSKNDFAKEGSNNNGSKLVRKKMIFNVTKITTTKRISKNK